MKQHREEMQFAIGKMFKAIQADQKAPKQTKELMEMGFSVLAASLDCLASIADSLDDLARKHSYDRK